jgi:hypothetical protein
MRSGERSLHGALWAIAHSIAAAADALDAGVVQRLDEINRGLQEFTERYEDPATIAGHIRDREAGYADRYLDAREDAFEVPFLGAIDIRPADPTQTISTGVLVEPGTYRLVKVTDERPEGDQP